MMATAFKEPGEPTEANWTSSEFNVSGAVVGAGGDTCTYGGDSGPLPHSGSVETCEGSGGAANLDGATGSGGSAPGLNGLIGVLPVVGFASLAGLIGSKRRRTR